MLITFFKSKDFILLDIRAKEEYKNGSFKDPRVKNIPVDEAMGHVLGYPIGLDITARDLQKSDPTWFRGKGFDTFAPVGPIIVPRDQVNLDDCTIQLFINGEEKQKGNTRDFIFKLPTIIN